MSNQYPNYTPQDLTAYALGELDPTSDAHRAIAQALDQDPTLQAEIDAIKQSAQAVRDALAREPVPAHGGTGILPVGTTHDRQDACPTSKHQPAPLFARPALLAAGFALAAGAAITAINLVQPTPGPPESSTHTHAHNADAPQGLAAIHAALQTPITASFQNAPLSEVFDAVEQQTHADLAVDWPALEARGIARDTAITFDADDLPARDLLSLALAACWQQLPHPDPAVWTVTPTQVRIEPRSATVQRSLDHAQVVLASANTTNANMTQSQLALADDAGWQEPETWTDAYWDWRTDGPAMQQQQQSLQQMESLEEEVEYQREAFEAADARLADRNRLPANLPSVALVERERSARPSVQTQQSLQQASQQLQQMQQNMQQQGQQGVITSGSRTTHADGIFLGGATRNGDVDLSLRPMVNEVMRLRTNELSSLGSEFEETRMTTGRVLREVTELRDQGGQMQQAQQQAQQSLMPRLDPQLNRDTYALVNDNPFYTGFNDPLSTFSVDVDTAAYALVRRQVMQQGQSPVPGAVRIEEMVNYFDYSYAAPVVEPELLDNGVVTRASLERLAADDDSFAPFATHVEVTDCPWADGHQLVRIGIKGMEVEQEDRAPAHLTFLLDVSGSMSRENKLPLVVESMKMLLTQLNPDPRNPDHVSIVVYAGAAGVVLEHAAASDPAAIEEALSKLSAGGSTAGGAGIELAYNIAQRHFVDGGVNRVILCTDGDFNVGISDRDALVDLIKQRANPEADDSGTARGVYLSVLGFGMGNLNDAMMEPLTNAGNGNYAYIDSAAEAHKVMVEQVGGTLVAIAKDVKIQVEFNPARVLAYRLIGYENRILAHEDFENDTVDAGDIGAGHTVTALYEIVPFPGDGLGDDERVLEVKRQIEALDEALAFSASVLENTPLTDEQYRKLMGSAAMMQQQRAVAAALQETVKRRPPEVVLPQVGGGIELRYRRGLEIVDDLDELMVVNLRYKPVDAPAEQGTSRLIQTVVAPEPLAFGEASADTRFAAAVAGYGMVLRNSPHRGDASFRWVLDTAGGALGEDVHGYRAGFVSLVERSAELRPADAEKERNVIAPR